MIGSGAGGVTAAITRSHAGPNVIAVDLRCCEGFFGRCPMQSGKQVPQGSQRLRHERGDAPLSAGGSRQPFDAEAFDTRPDAGPEATDFLEREPEVKLVPTLHPGYHPQYGGGVDIGRPFLATTCASPQASSHLKRLRPPLQTARFMGMMFDFPNADIKHLFNATRSLKSLARAAKKLACHATEVRFGNGSNTFHDVGPPMMETSSTSGTANAWLICNRATIRRRPPGCARPAPAPLENHLRNGPPEHRRSDFVGARPIAEAKPVPG